MTKDIWHTTKEKPMLQRDIILCGDGWSMAIDIIPETVNNICWKNVEKWCYLDDLIKENDRTRKALDVANEKLRHCVNMTVEELDELKGNLLIAYDALLHFSKDPIANNALKKITALEQKD